VRTELKAGLLLISLAILINRFAFFPIHVSDFLCGAFLGFGLFLIAVNLLPQKTYDNLLYRKWIASRTG
jgi:pilus assembly protein TadC